MQQDENHHAGPSALPPSSPSDSNHDTSSGAFPPSAKLRDKLKKLANQRLDLSSIEFVDGTPAIRGGFATVSRALLSSPSSGRDGAGRSDSTENGGFDSPGPAGEASRQRKDVAVKRMNISDDTDPARVLGLALREAEFLVGFSHENIIKLEGFVEDLSKNVVWLVFPWAENGNLKDFIASAEWEIPERISLIFDVAKGVEYLHSQHPPIRHGDLKSVNILINSEYRAVITDFGSARCQTPKDQDEETSHAENKPPPTLSLEPSFSGATNTMTLTLKGDHFTLRWAAPEVLLKKKATVASDIWALGCVVYEVMTDSIPFQDVDVDNAVVIRIVTGKLPAITDDARMVLIKALCSLAIACWSEDPRKRPTAEDCRKSINFLPMIRPNPIQAADTAASRARSPALLMTLGVMYLRQGDYTNASDFFTKALGHYAEIGDSTGKAEALAGLAHVHRLRNEYSQAVTFYTEALQIRTDIGDRRGRADALWGLATVHRLQNKYSQAVTFYTEVLQICTDIGDRQGRADALFGLAEVHRVRNEYSQAVKFYTEALQIRTDVGDRQGRAYALFGLATVHRLQTEYRQAVTFYTEALQIQTDIGNRQGRADVLWALAKVHQLQNEHSQAVTFYTEALQIRTDIGDRQGRADALDGLADVHRVRNEYSQAVTSYTESLQIRTDIGDRQGRADALWGLAEVHRVRNEYSQAVTLYSESLDICTDIGNRKGRAMTLRSLARVHHSQQEYSQAITLFSEALEICTDIGDRYGRAFSLLCLGDVHRDLGNHGDAIGPYTEAAEVFKQIGGTRNAAYASRETANARRLFKQQEAT